MIDDTDISLLDGSDSDSSETDKKMSDDNGIECFEKYQHLVIYVPQNYPIKLFISL